MTPLAAMSGDEHSIIRNQLHQVGNPYQCGPLKGDALDKRAA